MNSYLFMKFLEIDDNFYTSLYNYSHTSNILIKLNKISLCMTWSISRVCVVYSIWHSFQEQFRLKSGCNSLLMNYIIYIESLNDFHFRYYRLSFSLCSLSFSILIFLSLIVRDNYAHDVFHTKLVYLQRWQNYWCCSRSQRNFYWVSI